MKAKAIPRVHLAVLTLIVATLAGPGAGTGQENSPPITPALPATSPATPVPPESASEGVELPETVVRATPAPAPAEPAPPEPATPPTVAESSPFAAGGAFDYSPQGPFMPDVQGTKIYAGKKTSEVDLKQMPPISQSNYRQAFIQIPGLLVAEDNASTIQNFSYRGLDPENSQFMQILKDGFPITADIFGYPELYYNPPLQVVDHIDFIRGGSALLYGPQPGGALNYVTKDPVRNTPFSFYSQNLFGSHNLFSTYDAISGTNQGFGYYLYGMRRQTDGFRQFNSTQEMNYGGGKIVTQITPRSRLITQFDFYYDQHGVAGGLTQDTLYAGHIRDVTRPYDRLTVQRNFGYMTYQEEINDSAFAEVRFWGGYQSRQERNQNGEDAFGMTPTGPGSDTNTLQTQTFYTFGIEPRFRFDYDVLGLDDPSTLTVGTLFYRSSGNSNNKIGMPPTANSGELTQDVDRLSNYWSLFAENRFNFGRLNIVPSARMEFIQQTVQELRDVDRIDAGLPLQATDNFSMVPLFGLGVTYDLTDQPRQLQPYFNASQAYRPITYADLTPLGPNTAAPAPIKAGYSYQLEAGVRGTPTSWLYYDSSFFYLDISNKVAEIAVNGPGSLTTLLVNSGEFVNKGYDFSLGVDVIGLLNEYSQGDASPPYGKLTVFGNAQLLDARIIRGPLAGNRPQFAPGYLVRTGIIYNLADARLLDPNYQDRNRHYYDAIANRVQILFSGTLVDGLYGSDDDDPTRVLRPYNTWDFTVSLKVYRNAQFVAGVNNVFSQLYAAWINDTGIQPADRRNHYLGFQVGY